MPKIRGNQIFVGKIPIGNPKSTIVVSVFDRSGQDLVRKLEEGSLSPRNLYEIRYDLFERRDEEDLVFLLKDLDQLDVDYIFTFRSGNQDEFNKMYSLALSKLAPAVDMDLAMYRNFGKKPVNSNLLLSFHTENRNEIHGALSEMVNAEPDMFKVASYYQRDVDFFSDLVSICRFKEDHRKPLSFIPMGNSNSFLRIVSAYEVSDFVYAKSDLSTAEGQISYKDYEQVFRHF